MGAKSGVINKLMAHFPARTKRLIFIASFSANVRSRKLDHETIRRLNALFDLCATENAMQLPGYLSKVIWNNEVVYDLNRFFRGDETVSESNFDSIVRNVIELMPSWMRYDDKETEEDVRTLLIHRKEVFG